MARLPALIAALAKTDGRDEKALAWFGRFIREGGLITTTKPGRGAAEMTSRDAANLLIAANVAGTPRHAISQTKLLRAFVPRSIQPKDEHDEDSIFGELSRASDFGAALEKAIDGAPEIALLVLAQVKHRFADEPNAALREHAPALGFAGFDVEFQSHGGSPTTAKLILWQADEMQRRDDRVWKFQGNTALIESGYYAHVADFDRYSSVRVGLKTLLNLSAAVICPDEMMTDGAAETIAAISDALESDAT